MLLGDCARNRRCIFRLDRLCERSYDRKTRCVTQASSTEQANQIRSPVRLKAGLEQAIVDAFRDVAAVGVDVAEQLEEPILARDRHAVTTGEAGP